MKTSKNRLIITISMELDAIRSILTAFLTTRLMIFFVIFLSMSAIPVGAGAILFADPNNVVTDGLVRYDSWWYHNIVTQGYNTGNLEKGLQGNTAFFPFYPLLIKIVSFLTGSVFSAAIFISNVAFLAILIYLYALVKVEYNEDAAGRAVFYLAAAPTAIFFSAMYTESLYIAFVVATFYYARQKKWVYAALTGALAAATRNTGIIMAAAIVLEGLSQEGLRFLPAAWKQEALKDYVLNVIKSFRQAWQSLLAGSFATFGLIAYMAYLSNKFGDPLSFIHVQATWGRSVGGTGLLKIIPTTITALNLGPNLMMGQVATGVLLDLFATLAFLPLVVIVALKMRPAYGVYALATFIVPLSTGTVGSMRRYILMLIPCFILLALWGKNKWVDRIIMGISLPLMAYLAVLFSHWIFAG